MLVVVSSAGTAAMFLPSDHALDTSAVQDSTGSIEGGTGYLPAGDLIRPGGPSAFVSRGHRARSTPGARQDGLMFLGVLALRECLSVCPPELAGSCMRLSAMAVPDGWPPARFAPGQRGRRVALTPMTGRD